MIRFTLSRFRAQATVAAVALAVIAVVAAIIGPHLAHLWNAILAPCLAAHPGLADHPANARQDCLSAMQGLAREYGPYGWLRDAAGMAVLVVPGLIGVFWGAPLVAPELATGTYRLAWTQGVTRSRWLAVKLGLIGLASVGAAGLLTLVVTSWASPVDRLDALAAAAYLPDVSRFQPLLFSERGVVPAGYAAFAFALGATAGALLRRTLPAMVIALAGFPAALLAMMFWVRPHLAAATHRILAITKATPIGLLGSPGSPHTGTKLTAGSGFQLPVQLPNIPGAWIFSDQIVGKAGHGPTYQYFKSTCAGVLPPATPTRTAMQACNVKLAAAGFHQLVTLQPASRYWPFQWYETATFTALALALAACCLWWIQHRPA